MNEIASFFDFRAEHWDRQLKDYEIPIIRQILRKAGVNPQDIILDVGCGTGILIPFLFECYTESKNITGIDISKKMIEMMNLKFPQIKTYNCDFLTSTFPPESFTKVIIFNTFPHFLNPLKVLEISYKILKKSGKIIIAHTMTREKLDHHHKKSSAIVQSHHLISDEQFQKYFQAIGFKEVALENDLYFYSEGKK